MALAPVPAEAQGSVEGDRAALEALYDATNGDNWTTNTNWKSDMPLGTWSGVVTNSNGRVTSLSLQANNLAGTIPAELGELTELQTMFVTHNVGNTENDGLTGSMPAELGRLSKLITLDLGINNLTGSIPPSLDDLASLSVLSLSNNNLTGSIPPSLGDLASLSILSLAHNSLTGSIPTTLGALGDTLSSIFLQGNGLTGCVPYGLRNAATNDFTQAGLSICPPTMTLVLSDSSITESGGTANVTATLNGAPGTAVTLTVSAAPVPPAVAGDFTLSGSILTIAADSTTSTGTVTITALDNDAPHPNGRVTISAMLPDGFMLPDSAILANPQPVTLTITDDEGGGRRDAELILAGTARSMASDAVDVIAGRFDASSTDGGSQMTLAGQVLRLDPQNAQGADTVPWHGVPVHSDAAWWDDRQQTATALSAHDLLTRSSFVLALADGDSGEVASGLTLWGRGSVSGFSGSPDAGFNMNGSFGSGWLGLDYRVQSSVLVGIAITHGAGTVNHGRTGRLETETGMTLTSVLPYAHLQVAPGLELWGMFGGGHGNMEVSAGGTDILTTEIVSFMRAMGGRQTLTNLAGIDLAARADAFSATLHTEATADLPEASGSAQRVRLLIEGSRASGQIASRFTLGGRWDGGTADTGVGLEVGGGLAWTQAATGLNVELQGRYLLAHTANGYEDWGASLDLHFDPGADERGLMFSLSPTLGGAASGAEHLYGNADLTSLVANDNRTGRLDAELAYGVAGFGGAGTVTPYGRLTLDGADAARYRLGSRLVLDPSLDLTLEGSRSERNGAPASHGIFAQLGLRW